MENKKELEGIDGYSIDRSKPEQKIAKISGQIDKLLEIAKSLPEYFSEQGLSEMEKNLKDQIIYGAYDGDELVGFVSYEKMNEDVIEIKWIAVLEKLQGKGVGTKLLLESLEIEGKNFSVCEVKTLAETVEDEGYAKTRAFYKELGFISVAIIDPYPGWGPDNPCQIFVKFLKK